MDMNIQNKIFSKMVEYYAGDPKRIQHFAKVYTFAKIIGERECLSDETLETLLIAAIVHDIGIKTSEEKYNSSNGKYQEIEGEKIVREFLSEFELDKSISERVVFLVGHHHTYNLKEGIDYQILIEADFLVNAYEDNLSKAAIEKVMEKIFSTKSGTDLLKTMFGI